MFEPSSRYYNVPEAQYTMPDGRRVSYKRRLFLPQGDTLPSQVDVLVRQGDRLDLIAARTLGDPEQFWRIANANNAMDPFDLTASDNIGRIVRVPRPQF
jgi:nucleoid-associated protein YgaU